MFLFLYNFAFYIIFILYGLTLSPFLFVILPIKLLHKRLGDKILRYGVWFYGFSLIRIVLSPFIKCRLLNEANWKREKPCIFVANHNASSDAFIFGLMPPMEAVMVVQSWPFKIPLIGFFARQAGYIKIDSTVSENYLEEAMKILNEGVSIIIFPEGTRAGCGPLGEFNSLAFRIAKETGVDIVPLVITGNRYCPPKGSLMIRPSDITLTILEPITKDYYDGINTFVLKNKVRKIIHNKLLEIEGVPPVADKTITYDIMPHKPPMLLVDKIIESGEAEAVIEVKIKKNCIFADKNGNVDLEIFPELIAQSVALNEAWKTFSKNKTKNTKGFVVSFKSIKFYKAVKIFDTLRIKVLKEGAFENLNIIYGQVFYGDIPVAEGEVRIWAG